jgi:hypothetical protein
MKSIGLLLCSLALFSLAHMASAQTIPDDAHPNDPTCNVDGATVDEWFGGRVKEDGAASPANSVKFQESNNCDFYRWSERMFLGLTSPAATDPEERVFQSTGLAA